MRPAQPAEDVLQMLQPEAGERGLYLQLEADPLPDSVLTDVGLVRQVLLNLVGNALKFTPTGGVTVRVHHRDSRLRYDIVDTGIGLPADLGDRVFDAFVRGDPSSTTAHPGSGLGLAISRRFARLLDGDVTFRSTPPGTTFVLEVNAPVSTEAPPAAVTLAPSPPGRVLVADDNAVNRTVIRALLGQLGVETEVVDDGDAAIAAARRGGWDLILMDCRMPGLDGYDATRALRRQGLTTPIVALSASNLSSDREACAEAGMDDYLSKPVTLQALRQVVARWVRDPTGSTTP
jgi:CheY-like chemotaxis protein